MFCCSTLSWHYLLPITSAFCVFSSSPLTSSPSFFCIILFLWPPFDLSDFVRFPSLIRFREILFTIVDLRLDPHLLSFALHYYYFASCSIPFHLILSLPIHTYPYQTRSAILALLRLRPSGRLSALMDQAFHALSASSSTHLHATPSDLRFYRHRSGPWPLLVKCALHIHPPTQVYL